MKSRWEITEMQLWTKDIIDDPETAVFEINGGLGNFNFISVTGSMDIEKSGKGFTFTWSGFDDGDDVSGSGQYVIDGDVMMGTIKFHMGDKSGFIAKRIKDKVRLLTSR